MLMKEMELPVSAIRGYIENAIDIVIQIDRLSDGKRKVTSISEVSGFNDGRITLKEIFNFKQKGLADDSSVIGEFGMSKVVPKVYDKIKRKGITTVDYLYKKSK